MAVLLCLLIAFPVLSLWNLIGSTQRPPALPESLSPHVITRLHPLYISEVGDGVDKWSWQEPGEMGVAAMQTDPIFMPQRVMDEQLKMPVVVFDGHNDWVRVPELAERLRESSSFTVVTVVTAEVYKDSRQYIWSAQLKGTESVLNRLGVTPRNQLTISPSSEPHRPLLHSERIPGLDQWSSIIVNHSENSVRVIRDGKKVLTVPLRKPLEFQEVIDFYIGQDRDVVSGEVRYTDFFAGKLADFIVFDRSLTEKEESLLSSFLSKSYHLKD